MNTHTIIWSLPFYTLHILLQRKKESRSCHLPLKWSRPENAYQPLTTSKDIPLIHNTVSPSFLDYAFAKPHRPSQGTSFFDRTNLRFVLFLAVFVCLKCKLSLYFPYPRKTGVGVGCRRTARGQYSRTPQLMGACQHTRLGSDTLVQGHFVWPFDHFDHTLQNGSGKHACESV